jgi:hypothetical protein
MTHDPKCNRCGTPLKIVEVKVPVTRMRVEIDYLAATGSEEVTRYETREEVADCPRCTGAY